MSLDNESSLSRVLAPVNSSDFFSEYWEKKPLLVSRSDDTFFSDLLAISDIDALLSTQALYFPAVQLSPSSDPVAVDNYTDDNNRILSSRLVEYYRSGATIVFSQAHHMLDKLADFTRHMQSEFQLRCQANVYMSPPGNQGFSPHYDAHDVLILQVSGRKTFSFYAGGTELPFTDVQFDSNLVAPGEKQEDIELAAGDTLYIPRGCMHDARSHESQPSIHITLGVFPVVMRDLLQMMAQIASEQESTLRSSIPRAAWVQAEYEQDSLFQDSKKHFSNAFSNETLNEAVSRLRDEVSLHGVQSEASSLQEASLVEISPESVLEIRCNRVLNLERQGQHLKLRTVGQILAFDEPMSSAVEQLVNHGQVKVSSLAGLAEVQQLAFSRRLLLENVAVLV